VRLGERVVLAAFVAEGVLAGGNAVGVRFSNRELDPLWGATVRFSLAAAVLLAIMVVLRLTLPRGRGLTGALLYGALNFGVAFGLAYYAFVELHAGFGQILLAIVPLVTLLLAVAQRQERLRTAAVVGALLALVGIAIMSQAPLRESVPVWSFVAALASAFCFAQAAIVVRRFPPVHPIAMNAVGMAAAAVILLAASLVADESVALPERGETWLALLYLVLIGSVIVFGLYVLVLQYWEASRAAYLFVLTPVVTVFLSAWLDDEPITWALLGGGFLVLAGVYVGALRPPEHEQEPADAAVQAP
jgi:drug/metabolite transporter (DMT)-like permease